MAMIILQHSLTTVSLKLFQLQHYLEHVDHKIQNMMFQVTD